MAQALLILSGRCSESNEKDNYCVVIALGAQRDRRLFCPPELLRLGETALGMARPAPVKVLSSISQIAENR